MSAPARRAASAAERHRRAVNGGGLGGNVVELDARRAARRRDCGRAMILQCARSITATSAPSGAAASTTMRAAMRANGTRASLPVRRHVSPSRRGADGFAAHRRRRQRAGRDRQAGLGEQPAGERGFGERDGRGITARRCAAPPRGPTASRRRRPRLRRCQTSGSSRFLTTRHNAADQPSRLAASSSLAST